MNSREESFFKTLVCRIESSQSLLKASLVAADEGVHLPFVGKFNVKQNYHEVVSQICKIFDIDADEYRGKKYHTEAFKYLRQKIEKKGVFILLEGNLGSYHTNISLNAFRGFSLCDDIAPYIVINLNEKKSRSFTLIHELTHILLGLTESCVDCSQANHQSRTEKFCDNVASNLLLPENELKKHESFFHGKPDKQSIFAKAKEIADAYFISPSQVLYRWLQLKMINNEDYKYFTTQKAPESNAVVALVSGS